ncbi:MAG: hypothetical protein V4819_07160 [Verrucomicrobiota bacterium]
MDYGDSEIAAHWPRTIARGHWMLEATDASAKSPAIAESDV